MAKVRWEMKIGSTVTATDGDCGHLEQVFVDPRQERIVALLVRPHALIARPAVVPENLIAEATENEVRLTINQAQVAALSPARGSELILDGEECEADDELPAAPEAAPAEVERASRPTEADPTERPVAGPGRKRRVLRLRAGHQVFCRDGFAGQASLILFDPDGRVQGFVLHSGHLHLIGRDLIVPAGWIQALDANTARLSVERDALATLPDYGPDDALEVDVDDALWSDAILRNSDYEAISVSVQDGLVTLRGYVATSMNKIRAESAAQAVAGVLGVENRLAVDKDLEIEVAQAFGKLACTRTERICVGAKHGNVTLTGQVSSAAVRRAAETAAAQVPQVRAIINYLQAPGVVIDPAECLVRQPPIGREVYATDMPLGQVERVIVRPCNRRVTAFVAHGYFPEARNGHRPSLSDGELPTERRVVIPVEAVRYETETAVLLSVSGAEAALDKDFEAADFASPPADWQPPYPYRREAVLFTHHDREEMNYV